MSEHNQENQKAELRSEIQKYQTAVSDASQRLAGIEEEEKRKREEKEKKERELASSRSQLEACQHWILSIEKEIAEAKERVPCHVADVCLRRGPAIGHLGAALLELATSELKLVAFKDYEISLQDKIEAH